MVTLSAAGAWALAMAILGLTAPVTPGASLSFNRHQTVVSKPIDPPAAQSPVDATEVRPLPPGVYRAGEDVSAPQLKDQVLPHYTSDAMRMQIQGIVRLEGIVGIDGKISDVRVVRSLDVLYGLDESAVRAVKQWTFEPGKKDGVPVPVLITIDSTFTMSPSVRPNKSRR
jgi:TonB family protein